MMMDLNRSDSGAGRHTALKIEKAETSLGLTDELQDASESENLSRVSAADTEL